MNYFYGSDMYPTITEMSELAPSLGGAAAASNPWLSLMANPAVQTTLLNFAQALDPKGFGGRLADTTRQAIQSAQTAKANAMATGIGATNAQVPQPAVAPPAGNAGTQPGTPAPIHDPMDIAQQYTKYGSALKTLSGMNPNYFTPNASLALENAFNSQPAVNPTQAVDSQAAGQPSAAMNPVQPFEIPETMAMAMTPELVQNAFTHRLNVQKTANETRAQNNADAMLPTEINYKQAATDKLKWDIDPQRVEDTIRVNREQVMNYLELHKGKQQFDIDTAKDFVSRFPGLSKTKIPYSNMTYGQAITMAAYNPQGSQNISGLINAGLDYRAQMARMNADMEMTKIRAVAEGKAVDANKMFLTYEKVNKDIMHYSSDIPAKEWEAMEPEQQREAIALGRNPRTPEREQALQQAIMLRDTIGRQLMPNTYDDFKVVEQNASKAAGGVTPGIQSEINKLPYGYTAQTDKRAPGSESRPFTLKADPQKLKDVERSMPTAGGPTKPKSVPSSMWQMMNIFNSPYGGKS